MVVRADDVTSSDVRSRVDTLLEQLEGRPDTYLSAPRISDAEAHARVGS